MNTLTGRGKVNALRDILGKSKTGGLRGMDGQTTEMQHTFCVLSGIAGNLSEEWSGPKGEAIDAVTSHGPHPVIGNLPPLPAIAHRSARDS